MEGGYRPLSPVPVPVRGRVRSAMLPAAAIHKDRLLVPHDRIDRSITIAPREYRLASNAVAPGKAAVTIRGRNITVDFQGATLAGSAPTLDPDLRAGVGLRVEGANVTIKNARIRGYKVAIWAKGVKGLRLVDCDLGYNWRQRLRSTREREDLDDWMSYHQNERDEWLRYGAAAYLDDCDGFEVRGLRVTGGQNGLMLDRCDGGLVWNSDLSFNSGVGLGMYRSTGNRVMHNRIDYCVRGYSHGVYQRGQDSAAILVYEQSSRNTFAYNSATHSGDGFFLWAGQSTMDTGRGGCDDNLLYGNDFSYAPTNGVEVTFSRNRIVNNRIDGCWHGIWGGYSHDTLIAGNEIDGNEVGIAIEHGQDNRIVENSLAGNRVGVHLWQNPTQDPAWGYPKHRDTRSRDTRIESNSFGSALTDLALDLTETANVVATGNTFTRLRVRQGGNNPGLRVVGNEVWSQPEGILPEQVALNEIEDPPAQYARWVWTPFSGASLVPRRAESETRTQKVTLLKGGRDPFATSATEVGRHTIRMGEWGPYDGRSPLIWPTQILKDGQEKFSLFGPTGRYRVVSSQGVTLSSRSGAIPGSLIVTRTPGEAERELVLEYTGRGAIDDRGVVIPAGRPVRVRWSEFRLPIQWNVAFYRWDETLDANDPRRHPNAAFASEPIHRATSEDLDYASSGAFYPGGPADRFATRAEATVDLPRPMTLALTADDGLRVLIDGQTVLDEWHYEGPTPYRITIPMGAHRLMIEHFEIDGYATLQARLTPK